MAMKHRNKYDCYTAYSHPTPRKFGAIIPDMIAENNEEKIAYFFHGCQVHGHFDPRCTINSPFSNRNTKNMFKKTFGEMEKRFAMQREVLLRKYNFTQVVLIWECQFNRMKNPPKDETNQYILKENVVIKAALAQTCAKRPKERLIPRQALRGGKVEVSFIIAMIALSFLNIYAFFSRYIAYVSI